MTKFLKFEDSIINIERIERFSGPNTTAPFRVIVYLISSPTSSYSSLIWSYDTFEIADMKKNEILSKLKDFIL